jgi:Mn2+/Fe2+ NRAMP family transporter
MPRLHHRRTWRQFFRIMGPGIVSGAADNDPAGVITYIQIGATTGFSLLWLMLLSTPILYYLEDMSSRLGIVGKRGISRLLRRRYGAAVACVIVLPVVFSNVITIGADLSGTAAAVQLLTGVRWVWWVVPIAGLLAVLLVRASYRTISRGLLVLTPLFLLYVAAGFLVRPNWAAVLRATFLPSVRFTPTYLAAALALLGATLTPYMFFWQTTEEVEDHRRVADLKDERVDVAAGMIYANFVFYFIILAAAAVIPRGTAGVGTVLEAAATLRPVAGPLATLLFAIGFLASGIMAVPVMVACSAYTVAELFGWSEGLSKTVGEARGFYGLLAGALAVGAGVALAGISPVALMFWSSVVNGLLLAPLFLVLLMLCNDVQIVRGHCNGPVANVVGGGTVLLTLALGLLTVLQLLSGR